MATIDFPTSAPAATTWTGAEYADVVDHADDLHNKDRGEIRALALKLGTGSSTPARDKALVASGSGTSVFDTHQRRNRLFNGSGKVWQRGTSPTPTDNQYGPDRWRLLLEAASAAAIAKETSDLPTDGPSSGFRLTVGSGEDNKFGIFQVLEHDDVRDLRGKSVSLQAKIKATAAITDVRMAVLEWTSTADSVSGDPISAWNSAATAPTLATNWAYLGTPLNLSPTTSWATYRVEGLTVGASANNLAVMIWCEDESTTVTTDILRITDVQLEEGAVCTAVERRSMTEELALCQRYYWKTFPQATAPAQNTGSSVGALNVVFGTNNELAINKVVFPVVMRTTPTVTTYNPSAANANWSNAETATVLDAGDSGFAAQASGTTTAGTRATLHASAVAEL